MRNENRQLEIKLERRAQEIDELVTKITKLNNDIGSLESAGSSVKDENRELEHRLVELNREMSAFGSLFKDQKDKIAELGHTLHQQDVEIDGLRSSFTNKAAENEELMSQLSKQEWLDHTISISNCYNHGKKVCSDFRPCQQDIRNKFFIGFLVLPHGRIFIRGDHQLFNVAQNLEYVLYFRVGSLFESKNPISIRIFSHVGFFD